MVQMIQSEIAPADDPFQITPLGLRLIFKPTFQQWIDFGRKLWSIRTAIQWCVGDWLVYGEGRGDWGETYAQAHEVTQYSEHTLANLAWVSDRVEFSRRREDLSHSHHEAVAKLSPTTQSTVLAKAARDKWSREDVREEANRIMPPKPKQPPLPEPYPEPAPIEGWQPNPPLTEWEELDTIEIAAGKLAAKLVELNVDASEIIKVTIYKRKATP